MKGSKPTNSTVASKTVKSKAQKKPKLNLHKLLANLKKKARGTKIFNYTIPDLWNVWGYDGEEKVELRNGELIVNPYKFYSKLIEDYILPKANKSVDYSLFLTNINGNQDINSTTYKSGDWIKRAVTYSMMIRASTTWDHDRTDSIDSVNLYDLKETGTFVKTLALLPLLKKMGVNTVYMLPISKYSLRDKKGELGSPYGVSSFSELDSNLKDPISGDDISLEDEFKAFVEACHILNMRVIIDIIPRTNSVESDLILDHPDWFYWIKSDELENYAPPYVDELGVSQPATVEHLKAVYNSKNVWQHIDKFSCAPNIIDFDKWEQVRELKSKNPEVSILDLVDEYFGLTIAPAFSDAINDPQPPWSDVTFFRMYLDHPTTSKQYHGDRELPPYILFDTIKSNLHKGDVPNESLWNTLENIIPNFQINYGIDGARIDMGHALPSELVSRILSKAREIDPDFCFIAEELDPDNAQTAIDNGYNMIIGNGFMQVYKTWERKLHSYMYEVHKIPSPVFALCETHDTPRIAAREGRSLAKMLGVMNMFMPNGVPFINSGQEVYETQPMNIGIDCRDNELYMLSPDDLYYGKLALFDKYAFHYTTYDRWDFANTMEIVSHIRNEYLDYLINLNNYSPLGFEHMGVNAIGFGYLVGSNEYNNMLVIVGNTDPYNETHCTVDLSELRSKSDNHFKKSKQIFSTHEARRELFNFDELGNLNLRLQAGEVKIILI